jgi:hypothetical protein
MNLAAAYKTFSRFVQSAYIVKPPERALFHSAASSLLNTSLANESIIAEEEAIPRALKVLFVQRSKNRVILNMDELTSLADSLGFEW